MATHFYQYHIPNGTKSLKEELKSQKLIGVRTFENKKKCFTWQMQPGEFMHNLAFYSQFLGVVDEHGHLWLITCWLNEVLAQMDIMRYNKDEPLELDAG